LKKALFNADCVCMQFFVANRWIKKMNHNREF
jgi:hypothetical protein